MYPNFVWDFNLRRYTKASGDGGGDEGTVKQRSGAANAAIAGRGLHSSTFQLNLSRFPRHKIHRKHPLLTPDTPQIPP
jgi:hypothetical protein